VKTLIERLAVDTGLVRLVAGLGPGRPLILAYHNVVPDALPPVGDRSLHLPRAIFVEQLEQLAATCEIVPLSEIARPAGRGRRRVAITFDDAYRGAVTVGVPELVRRGMPATIFVAPAFVDDGAFWWDALASEAGLATEVRQHALDALGGDDAAIRAWAVEAGVPATTPPPVCRVATVEEMTAASAFDGLAFGSHTWSHRNLSRLDHGAVPDELARPLLWLRARFARVSTWLAYPYGIGGPPALEGLLREIGYSGGLLVSGGGLPPASRADPFRVPRLNVPAGLSRRGLAIRLAGLLED